MPSQNKIAVELDLDTQKLTQIYTLITPLLASPEVKNFIRDQLKEIKDPEAIILWDSFIRNVFSKMVKAAVDNIYPNYTDIIYNMQVSGKFNKFNRLNLENLFKNLENNTQFKNLVDKCRKSLPFQINYVKEVNKMLMDGLSSMTSKPIDPEYLESMLDTRFFYSNSDEKIELMQEIGYHFILLYLRSCIAENISTKADAERTFKNQMASISHDYYDNELLQHFVSNLDRDDTPVYDTGKSSSFRQSFFVELLNPLEGTRHQLAELGIDLAKHKILSTDEKISLLTEKLGFLTATVDKQSEQLEKQSEQLNKQSHQLIKQSALIEQLIQLLKAPNLTQEKQADSTPKF